MTNKIYFNENVEVYKHMDYLYKKHRELHLAMRSRINEYINHPEKILLFLFLYENKNLWQEIFITASIDRMIRYNNFKINVKEGKLIYSFKSDSVNSTFEAVGNIKMSEFRLTKLKKDKYLHEIVLDGKILECLEEGIPAISEDQLNSILNNNPMLIPLFVNKEDKTFNDIAMTLLGKSRFFKNNPLSIEPNH